MAAAFSEVLSALRKTAEAGLMREERSALARTGRWSGCVSVCGSRARSAAASERPGSGRGPEY